VIKTFRSIPNRGQSVLLHQRIADSVDHRAVGDARHRAGECDLCDAVGNDVVVERALVPVHIIGGREQTMWRVSAGLAVGRSGDSQNVT
jgi:hypothetical protein